MCGGSSAVTSSTLHTGTLLSLLLPSLLTLLKKLLKLASALLQKQKQWPQRHTSPKVIFRFGNWRELKQAYKTHHIIFMDPHKLKSTWVTGVQCWLAWHLVVVMTSVTCDVWQGAHCITSRSLCSVHLSKGLREITQCKTNRLLVKVFADADKHPKFKSK